MLQTYLTMRLPSYARELGSNLGTVLTPEGAPGLSEKQIAAIALSTAIASRNIEFIKAMEAWATPRIDHATVIAARAAAAIVGANTIYNRFAQIMETPEYQSLPAQLPANIRNELGIDRRDSHLLSLAVATISGCSLCMTTNEAALRNDGIDTKAIQSAVRIASVIHSTAMTLEYESFNNHNDIALYP